MSNDSNFEYSMIPCIIGVIFGVFFSWIFTAPYLPDLYPMMVYGMYMLGMIFIIIIIIVGYIKIDKDYWLVFSSLWLFVMLLWVMFAYVIYDGINIFIAWWRSNLLFNTGLILMVFAFGVLAFWGLREYYYKRCKELD